MPHPVFESPSCWPTGPAGKVPAAWVQLPSTTASELRSSAALDACDSSVRVPQPVPKRRFRGFWLALLAIILLALVFVAMVIYRGSQSSPISTAQPAVCSGHVTVPSDLST